MIVVEKHDITYYDVIRIERLYDTLKRLCVVSGCARGVCHLNGSAPRHYSIRFEDEV